MRLIFTDQNKEKPLPIEILLQQQLNLTIGNSNKSSRKHVVEVSGITILPDFRPKLAVLQLLRVVIKMSLENRITDLYAGLDACIYRALVRGGVGLHILGKIVDHHGIRQCYYGNIQRFIKDTYHNNPAVWEIISDNTRLIPDFAHADLRNKHDGEEY